MGIEDYRVILRSKPRKTVFPTSPSAGEAAAVRTAEQMAAALERVGFTRLPPIKQVGPAKLAAPSESEIRLKARLGLGADSLAGTPDDEYVVEALIRSAQQGESEALESLSVRFAVCQPEGSAIHFLKLIKSLCDTLDLEILHGNKTYSPDSFWAFRLGANEQIRTQEEIWQKLFEGDPDRVPIAVDEAWGHYLKKRPDLTDISELTMPRRSAAAAPCADGTMEETIAPKAAERVPIRRTRPA